MTTFTRIIGLVMILSIVGCSNLTPKGRDTAEGAGIGAVVGAILTVGHPVGVIGGAAVGGWVGQEGSRASDK